MCVAKNRSPANLLDTFVMFWGSCSRSKDGVQACFYVRTVFSCWPDTRAAFRCIMCVSACVSPKCKCGMSSLQTYSAITPQSSKPAYNLRLATIIFMLTGTSFMLQAVTERTATKGHSSREWTPFFVGHFSDFPPHLPLFIVHPLYDK